MKPSTRHKQPRHALSQPIPPSLCSSVSPSPPFSRLELLLFTAILLAAVFLRLHALSHSAVEHFDEGIYASNIYFGPPDYAYPQQRFFGPPLLPALIETGMVLQFPPNVAALLPSFLAGCGTIAALWWFGRSWFGPAAGITAAGLAAFSDFQILFSTTALTDTLLGLWLLLAVDAMARSLINGDLRWAIGAGLCTGLAWWSKYNGWLPLAIEAAAIFLLFVVGFVRTRGRSNGTGSGTKNPLTSWLACFTVTSLVAAAVWSPYFFSLQSHGGYAPIAANHAKYVVGLTGWLDSVSRQLVNQQVISSWLGALGIFVAVSLPALFGEKTRAQRLLQCSIAASLSISALIFTSIAVLVTASSIGLLRVGITRLSGGRLAAPEETANQTNSVRSTIGFCLLAAWWLGLFLSVPCYTPYSRLALPFALAAYLAAPLFTLQLVPQSRLVRWLPLLACPALLAASIAATFFFPRPKLDLAKSRLALQTIAREIHQISDEGSPRVIYTCAEPALFFQLRAAGEAIVSPIQNIPITAATIDNKSVPTFLLTGPHTEQDPQFQKEWLTARQRWKLLQTFDYQPSALVYLDLHDPRSPNAPSHSIHLYQLENDE